MDIKAMEYVLAIAREKNISGAARRVGISQPTMSIFLSNLERELGTDLFYRKKKKLTPTPAGHIYLSAAVKILDVKMQTYQTVYRLTHEQQETITVGATPLRGSIMVAQIFTKFNRRFPNVKVEIREGYMQELNKMTRRGEVTYVLGACCDTETSDADHIVISKEELVIGVPSFHRLADQGLAAEGYPHKLASIQIKELADSPFILFSPQTTVRTITDHIFSKEGIIPTIVFETSNGLVLSNMIRKGTGAGVLPRSAMIEDTDDIVYFSLSPRYYLNLALILQKNRRLSEAERYLAYLVIQQDRTNPSYIPAPNAFAQSIWDEFCEEGYQE